MKKSIKTLIIFFLLVISSITLTSVYSKQDNPKLIHIIAVGDIVAHIELTNSGIYGKGFNKMFEKLSPYFKKADYVIANMEAPVAEKIIPSGYPKFNAHPLLAKAARDAGINFFSVANTHSLDHGASGISGTIETLKKFKIDFNGMYNDEENHYKPTIINIKGIKCAIFSVVTETNNIPNPRGARTPKVNIIRTKNEINKSINEVKKIRPEVDLIILTLHDGIEKNNYPSNKQKQLAQLYSKAGVDVIFGSNPHVLQPFEWVNNKTFCIYSLSNILSYLARGITINNWQSSKWRTAMGDGLLMHIFAEKRNNQTKIVKICYTPTWTISIPAQSNKYKFDYYATPLKEEIEAIENSDNKFNKKNILPLLQLRREYIIKMYGKEYLMEGLNSF